MNLFSNSIEIENYCIKNFDFLKDNFKNIVISRLLILRLIICFLMLSPIFFVKDEIFLMILSGTVIVPLVGFVVPIICEYQYNKIHKNKKCKDAKIILAIITIFINVFSAYYIIYNN